MGRQSILGPLSWDYGIYDITNGLNPWSGLTFIIIISSKLCICQVQNHSWKYSSVQDAQKTANISRATVFIWIVAAATINCWSAATNWGWLLFEDVSYYFEAIPPPAIHKNSNVKDHFFITSLRITEIWKQISSLRTKPRTSFAMLLLTIVHHLQSWPHPLNCVRACVLLLFAGGYFFILLFLSQSSRCGYYSRAVTIRGAASIRINTVLFITFEHKSTPFVHPMSVVPLFQWSIKVPSKCMGGRYRIGHLNLSLVPRLSLSFLYLHTCKYSTLTHAEHSRTCK